MTGVAVAGHIETASTGSVTLSSQSRKGTVFIIVVTKKKKKLISTMNLLMLYFCKRK